MGIEHLAINTIRTLSMDAVQAANSGHPGTPMALAPVAYTVWQQFLRYDPADPTWAARDRFVLSCGHASMLLYSLLHLAEVKQCDHYGDVIDEPAVPIEHIKKFRQLHSRCPGHPEFGETGGVETTTGPLGQGCGNSVGMAIAQKWLAARYNKPGFELFNGKTYVICSDGDLMEGVASEAASIAGHLKLSNLVWLYDDNKITIEGDTSLAFTENVGLRFKGYGWNVLHVEDANEVAAIQKTLKRFNQTKTGPTLIIVKSRIGYGSPNKAGSHKAHGEPLGADEIKLTKAFYEWTQPDFAVPPEVYEHFREGVGARGAKLHKAWKSKFKKYAKEFPKEADELTKMHQHELPADWEAALPTFPADAKGMASRASSGKVLNAVAARIPWLIGGSADLAPSTLTFLNAEGSGEFEPESYGGRNFHWGIREHGMAAALNGMSLSGVRAYGATFFVFTDYMRPSMRLSAIMKQPVLYILTHDSIGLGEDGPTHQAVEHLASLRAMPGMVVIRPGDANEVAEAYRSAMKLKDKPVALVLSRQNLPTLDRAKYAAASGAARGGYVLAGGDAKPQVILMATGSELQFVVAAYETLTAKGIKARVVSIPSWEIFDEQDAVYRESVLPSDVTARVACEAGVEMGWNRYLGEKGKFVGMSSFGASAPAPQLYKQFAITPEHVVEEALQLIGG
ncbi:MAG: transketolase [Planctomycetia bacterium]|nr:transketolase [Planctomycetia bacterium]